MIRDEAISVLERVAHTESKWPGTEDTLEALDMAISAIRQQETVTKCHDLYDEDGGDIYPEKGSICSSTNLPCCRCNPGPCEHRKDTVTERHELNEPLTLDELRKMDGEPVWVVWPDGRIKSQWFIISSTFWIEMFQEWDGTLSKDYGKTWLAYRQKPEGGTV